MERYQDRFTEENWLSANERIRDNPDAARLIVAAYAEEDGARARRTTVCAAGCNTPLWQRSVVVVDEGKT